MALAMRHAEAACRQEPGKGRFLRTLGVAWYRNGDYGNALANLTVADKLNAAQAKQLHSADLAFLALTWFQLGQKAEATVALARLREVRKQWPADPEAEALSRQAVVLEPKK